jgi:hypothetical protein
MVAKDSGGKGASGSDSARELRNELQQLVERSLAALDVIRRGESPKPTATAEPKQLTASDPELRDVERAVQNANRRCDKRSANGADRGRYDKGNCGTPHADL